MPRAIYSESIFSFAPLTIISIGYWLKNKKVILSAIGVPVIVIIITPIIMLNRLGWDKFFNDRLLAFFTFEGIAIIQIILILKMIKSFKK